MNFTKLQGAGNDFVLVESSGVERHWSRLAIALCDRHFGVGADGLLLLLPSDKADFRMRIFNPDGSEAEACGNGLRCLVKYALHKGLLSRKFEGASPLQNLLPLSFEGEGDKGGEVDKGSLYREFVDSTAQEILIETMAGVRRARLLPQKDNLPGIQVAMGTPKFAAEDIPVVIEQDKKPLDIKPILNYPVTIEGRELLLDFVSMGNPHAVYFCPHSISEFPLSQVGPKVETLAIFPNRINFEIASVLSPQQIEAIVWERGAGETLACGTGACAIAVAAQLHGYIGKKVDIKLPGGILNVEWDGIGEVLLGGPAEVVFTGECPEEGGCLVRGLKRAKPL